MIRTKEDAKQAIANVHPDMVFWLCDGTSLKNLAECRDALFTITDEAYCIHANQDKNDFANWIHDILKDDVLAQKLIGRKRKEAIELLKERIIWLQKKAKTA